ncbi:hypothetical protein QQ045_030210 [Rhodiola kirilowii]
MLFLTWKRYKHGHGVRPNYAGLIYWEMGKTDEMMALYKRAAALGDPAGQCNLAISYLKGSFSLSPWLMNFILPEAEPPNSTEAVKWLVQSSHAGYVCAQYQLALCLHQGQGVDRNLSEAARWYLKAAEGGYVRAMYNISLCYSLGEGLVRNHRVARKWMKRAADRGHSKAQYEHGLFLFLEGAKMNAVVYLELVTCAGETAASHVRDVILQQLSASSQTRVTSLADRWRALPSTV